MASRSGGGTPFWRQEAPRLAQATWGSGLGSSCSGPASPVGGWPAAGRWCWRFARGGRWTGSRRGVLRSAPPPLPCPGPAAPGNDANAIAQSGPRFPMGPRGIWGSAKVVTPPRIDASLRRRRASCVPRYPDPKAELETAQSPAATDRSSMNREGVASPWSTRWCRAASRGSVGR